MPGLRLYKSEKLCCLTAIDLLFSRETRDTRSALAYPWRAVWRVNTGRRTGVTGAQFLISVPKRRIRKATGRVVMRRRCREAYRLIHNDILPADSQLDVAFIYVGDGETDYAATAASIARLLRKMTSSLSRNKESQGREEGVDETAQ